MHYVKKGIHMRDKLIRYEEINGSTEKFIFPNSVFQIK